jgi:large subunit ribosomal protein L9
MAKARGRGKPVRRRDKKGGVGSGRRKSCQYCRDKVEQVDYKDVVALRKFISEKGKIRSRRITGSCRRHQVQIARAVKRARELALLPYVNEGGREDSPRRDRGDRVETLGEQGNVVDVSKGYLRNYLMPRKLAQPATKGAVEAIRQRQEAAERAERNAIEKAEENVNLLNRTVLTIPQQAGADGRLFGSVTAQDIANAIKEARGLKIDKRNVHLPEPIKNVGTYMVVVEVVDNVPATIKTMVVAKK